MPVTDVVLIHPEARHLSQAQPSILPMHPLAQWVIVNQGRFHGRRKRRMRSYQAGSELMATSAPSRPDRWSASNRGRPVGSLAHPDERPVGSRRFLWSAPPGPLRGREWLRFLVGQLPAFRVLMVWVYDRTGSLAGGDAHARESHSQHVHPRSSRDIRGGPLDLWLRSGRRDVDACCRGRQVPISRAINAERSVTRLLTSRNRCFSGRYPPTTD